MHPTSTAPQTLPADFFSKLPPDTLPANFDFSGGQPQGKPEGAVSRFLTRATGLPASDIAAHPGKYLNPLSDEYRQAAKDNANQPVTAPTLREMTPFGQTAKDIGDKNYAGALGDLAPGVLAALSMARMGRAPVAERVPLWKQAGIEAGRPAPNIQVTQVPEPAPRIQAASEQAVAAAKPEQQPGSQPVSYPEALNKRPTDRAEILDDKIVREKMQKDLGLQGYRGAREVGEENAPVPKWQQVAQAKAQSVIDSAHEQAAQILADAEKAATTPAKLTKTVAPKAAASAAQPVAEDLNSPDRLIDLMQQSIDRLKAAKGK